MVKAFQETLAIAAREQVYMRTAAYLLAVERVADATADARPLPVGPSPAGRSAAAGPASDRCYDRGACSITKRSSCSRRRSSTSRTRWRSRASLDNVEDLLTDVIT